MIGTIDLKKTSSFNKDLTGEYKNSVEYFNNELIIMKDTDPAVVDKGILQISFTNGTVIISEVDLIIIYSVDKTKENLNSFGNHVITNIAI